MIPFFEQLEIWLLIFLHVYSNQNEIQLNISFQFMLKQRKKVQLVIFPKIFNVLCFYSKGQYTIHISVIQETSDGKTTYAMPHIIQNSSAKMHESKKAYLKIEKQKHQLAFVSEQFYITYNEECVALHSMALFNLEWDPNSNTKTYIDFKLTLNRYKSQSKQIGDSSARASASAGGTIQNDVNKSGQISISKGNLDNQNSLPIKKRIVLEVDKRRIYCNNILDLDQYKRVVFSEPEYFSFLDVYIGSCFLGTRFRLQKYQLSQFYCFEDKNKIQSRQVSEQLNNSLSMTDRGSLLMKQVGCSVQQYRSKFNSQLQSSYTNLRKRMLHLIKKFQQQNHSVSQRNSAKKALEIQITLETIYRSKEQLQKQYKTQNNQQLFLQIYRQLGEFDNYLSYLWGIYIQLIQKISYKYFSLCIRRSIQKQNTLKQKNMVINTKIQSDVRKLQQSNFLKRRQEVLNSISVFQDDDIHHPFIMVQNYDDTTITEIIPSAQINSLVVFIHGYQGSDYDLQKAKNYLTLYSPRSYGLLIKSIQDQIDQHIEHLGERVAQQIKSHISGTVHNYRKISIIGYSLGGVIARQSLKHLSQFKDKMNLLITFATPHLGVSINDNKLVGTGIWYLINIEKVKNLKQLNCQKLQSQDQQITLNKLSDCESLTWFNKLIVVSSQQDNFVPYHSSRISEDIKDHGLQMMSKKILGRVKKIQRVEVWFDVDHDIKTFDKILGRRAHIEFLENRIFLDIFFRLYGKQF